MVKKLYCGIYQIFSLMLFVSLPWYIISCSDTIKDANIFDDEQEVNIGRQFSRVIEKDIKLYKDKLVTDYVNELGQLLAFHSQRTNIPYHFKVVDSGEINAFSLPGGYVYINRSIINIADTESELAAVISHEIGHIVGRHGAEMLTRQVGLEILSSVNLSQNALHDIISTGALFQYSQTQEFEADRYAIQEMYDAGVDPQGIINIFEKFQELQKTELESITALFSTHPPTTTRIEYVRAQISKLPQKSNLKKDSIRFHEIQERLLAWRNSPRH